MGAIKFLSTPSARRATTTLRTRTKPRRYFYPRPPRGGRLLVRVKAVGVVQFLSTPSARRATDSTQLGGLACVISIHALREEGDSRRGRSVPQKGFISIHALREEGDQNAKQGGPSVEISIHALREEGDTDDSFAKLKEYIFLSTPSARRATVREVLDFHADNISIHALREEGDKHTGAYRNDPRQFLSTPSARRATFVSLVDKAANKFLSTPSARRATRLRGGGKRAPVQFLSTPSARRATHGRRQDGGGAGDFYPRPPRGGRRRKLAVFPNK